jgi:hypothetical protein
MTQQEYKEFISGSVNYLNKRQDEMMAKFKITSYERFDWDQTKGTIVFSDRNVPKVVANIEIVGDVSKKSKTWLWSWANSTVDEKLKERILMVKQYGVQHGIEKITMAKWPADETDGWEMTAVAAKILNASGAYRTQDESGYTFMILTNVRWANNSKNNISDRKN